MRVSKHCNAADTKSSASTQRSWKRFPAWNPELYRDGVLELEAGYAESGRVVATLIRRAKSLGVQLYEGKFAALDESSQRMKGILLEHQPLHRVIPSKAKRSRGIPKRNLTHRGPSTEPVLSKAEGLGMTRLAADVIVMAVGAWTHYLVAFAKEF